MAWFLTVGRGFVGSATASAAAVVTILALLSRVEAGPEPAPPSAPPTLRETGLYVDAAALKVDPQHLAFSPQYPLWTDGAAKRRWISVPPGTAIDASDPDAWVFPVGTRLWKEFSFEGRRVETRYLKREADHWVYAAYAWSEDGREAHLVGARGRRAAYPLPGGKSHTIPGVADCKACHQGGRSEVLGFSALQLSPDRDPGALHADGGPDAMDLRMLVDRGLVVGLPQHLLDQRPRISASSKDERAALGYLHGNCGHCHNDQGSLRNVGLYLRQKALGGSQAIETTVKHPVRKPAPGQSPDAVNRIEPGHPERSGLVQRAGSRSPALQMPPLGTELVDREAIVLLETWIASRREEAHMSAEGRKP
jgi:mono/diheme cytochrome c family protein/uncharacterized protein YndB with AHSA1/START domain